MSSLTPPAKEPPSALPTCSTRARRQRLKTLHAHRCSSKAKARPCPLERPLESYSGDRYAHKGDRYAHHR
eukprot:6195589-Pleurochrysis_carterae.AAC.1